MGKTICLQFEDDAKIFIICDSLYDDYYLEEVYEAKSSTKNITTEFIKELLNKYLLKKKKLEIMKYEKDKSFFEQLMKLEEHFFIWIVSKFGTLTKDEKLQEEIWIIEKEGYKLDLQIIGTIAKFHGGYIGIG